MEKITLKQSPEDFMVDEIIDLKKLSLSQSNGYYLIIKIKKIQLNTLDAVNILQKQLNIPRKFISFAGLKDKEATTTQYFSIKSIKKESLTKIKHKNLTIEFIGYSNSPISLGMLTSNKFTIKLDFKPKTRNFMPNYFGEQRFSSNNISIGKAIIKKDFKLACSLINNKIIQESIKKTPNDFIGAIKKLDKRLISLYINAYQSYLWNTAVTSFFNSTLRKSDYADYMGHEPQNLIFPNKKIKTPEIPLISFDTEFKNKKIKSIYEDMLKKENIQLSDFLLRQFPEQLPITTERPVFIEVKNIVYNNKNKNISFELPKGSYATVYIKNLEVIN